jgi:hypothetical protein
MILDRIADLTRFGIPADYIYVSCAAMEACLACFASVPGACSSPCPQLASKLSLLLFIQVPSRPVDPLWFSNRSPVVSARQSAAIVAAMKSLGFLYANGTLKDDPRIGLQVSACCHLDAAVADACICVQPFCVVHMAR